eukprot:GFUD01010103.1.p1 GENE.GFUD01010103.1~~GFUD01010103.1.p1  ORF type:complete len:1007 (-),score=275.67 GFUD01010103.1:1080-4100(-)
MSGDTLMVPGSAGTMGSLHSPTSGLEVEEEGMGAMGYQQTLMYGRYSRSLGDQIKEEAKRQQLVEKRRRKEYRKRKKELRGRGECYQKTARVVTFIWKHTFARIGEDWVFLALLGMIMALVSFAMDYSISICNQARLWLVKDLVSNIWLQFLAWVSLPVFLVLFSTGFVHVVAPQAIGSGIPEMKTILRGVVLKEYLTFRTLIAKVVGLTATLGSGMPLGKEGPFVHIASIVATLLTKLVTSFQGIYANESRNSEMLAAACAVGVACCFGSPIGGVLFSIEVTSVYFAVRNYWRGFFAAIIGAIVFRLLSIWFEDEETIVAVFRTGFSMDFPYDPQELIVFTLIGVCCGLGGALYVYMHRRYVLWMRGNKQLTKFLQKNRFIYPFLISGLISAITFPPGPGMFQAADVTTHEQIETLFSNFTWAKDVSEMTVDEYDHIKHWKDPYTESIFVTLTIYILSTFFLSILAQTLPVPTGALIPSFKMGAAFGRLVGEAMHVWFPEGVRYGSQISYIMPGGYATVGAAAFSGAVTHTISISVIVFEMTGQITHCVPVLIAVLVANAIAACLQPSCYDSIILIKKLPYLPDIIPSSSGAYNFFVENFMVRDIKFIWYGMTYKQLRNTLRDGRKLRGFPLVDNPDQMVLLGSIQRAELISAIEKQIGKDRRLAEASVRRVEEKDRLMKEEMKAQEDRRIKELQEELEMVEKEREERERKEQAVNNIEGSPEDDLSISPPGKTRRPSRFAVSTVSDKADSFLPSPTSTAGKALAELNRNAVASQSQPAESHRQIKGILKKQTDSSFTIHGFAGQSAVSDMTTPYQTVSGASERWRNTVQNMQQMFTGVKKNSGMNINGSRTSSGWDFGEGLHSPMSSKKITRRMDMTLDEQRDWEKQEMEKPVNFTELHIDPAPFQLVEKSSLLKVHSLFSMLGVNHAYVTTIGRLIGVVGLKELRKAIEDANSGQSTGKTAGDEEGGRKQSSHPCTNNTVGSMDSMMSNSLVSDESDDNLLER